MQFCSLYLSGYEKNGCVSFLSFYFPRNDAYSSYRLDLEEVKVIGINLTELLIFLSEKYDRQCLLNWMEDAMCCISDFS